MTTQARKEYQSNWNRAYYRANRTAKLLAAKARYLLVWARHLAKLGWTEAEYRQVEQEQGGCCAICGDKPTERLCADHSHQSGKRRGLLCPSCNKALGFFRDDIRRLSLAIVYLRRFSD